MRIAICDDEEKFRMQEKNLIDKLSASLDVVVDAFADGRDLLKRFDASPYDLVFLDIEMPVMDGITLAREIRSRTEQVQIVFLTGHVEYAIEGYEVNALRYLTKPVNEEKLKEVLRFVMDKNTQGRQLILREDGEDLILNLTDIYYMEAQNQYVMIYASDGEHLIRANIGDFEEQLKNDGFYRIHRGFLVSLARIKKMQKGEVLLDAGSKTVTLPVSRSNIRPLKEALYTYVESEAF